MEVKDEDELDVAPLSRMRSSSSPVGKRRTPDESIEISDSEGSEVGEAILISSSQ